METLEPRTFLSAAPHQDIHSFSRAAITPLTYVPKLQHHAGHRVASKPLTSIDWTGKWAGTAYVNARTTTYPIAVDFTRQKGVAVTGMFSLGQMLPQGATLSTATIGSNPSFMVMVPGGATTAYMTGAAAANGKYINGRWSSLGPKGWTTGTFVLTRP